MNLFDISKNNFSQDSETGFEFAVKTPWGEDTDFFIKVRGEQSKIVRDYSKRKYNEYVMKEQAAKKRGKEYSLDLEEAEESLIESAIVRIISWRGIADNGKPLEFTKENAEKVLKPNDYIQAQILEESKLALNFRPV
jgi:hypothetical protein